MQFSSTWRLSITPAVSYGYHRVFQCIILWCFTHVLSPHPPPPALPASQCISFVGCHFQLVCINSLLNLQLFLMTMWMNDRSVIMCLAEIIGKPFLNTRHLVLVEIPFWCPPYCPPPLPPLRPTRSTETSPGSALVPKTLWRRTFSFRTRRNTRLSSRMTRASPKILTKISCPSATS